MGKWSFLLLIVLLVPFVHSMSVRDLISHYSFSTSSSEVNIVSFDDYMQDNDNNGVDDTLVLDLNVNSNGGNFIFIGSLFDRNGILINESNLTLVSGLNNVKLSFDSSSFSSNEFNYSIRVYNQSLALKYRIDNLITGIYNNYEKKFFISDFDDYKIGNRIVIEFFLNSSIEGDFEVVAYLANNLSSMTIRENKTLNNPQQKIELTIPSDKIKKSKIDGEYLISYLKIGNTQFKVDYATSSYDYRDFSSNYIDSFSDFGFDQDSNGKFETLTMPIDVYVDSDGYYDLVLQIYDQFKTPIFFEKQNIFLNLGRNSVIFDLDGSLIYKKQLDGPFVVSYAALIRNGSVLDEIRNGYITNYYDFNSFENRKLADLDVDISAIENQNNVTFNVTVRNLGDFQAADVLVNIFDNSSLEMQNITGFINPNSEKHFLVEMRNITDLLFSAFVFSSDDSNEQNNLDSYEFQLNKILINNTNNTTNSTTTTNTTTTNNSTNNTSTNNSTNNTTDTPSNNEPIIQISSSSGSSGGGGGGAGSPCISKWQCSDWGNCFFGTRVRKCSDANHCTISNGIPNETEKCDSFDENNEPLNKTSAANIVSNAASSDENSFSSITGNIAKENEKSYTFSGIFVILAALLIVGLVIFVLYRKKSV